MEKFAELFEQQAKNLEMREGQLIYTTVTSIDSKYVTLNTGLKSEAVIPTSEFKDVAGVLTITVGDSVQVLIESIEDGYGETRLSREKAKRMIAWNELEEALTNGTVLSGTVTGRVKGGLGVLYKEIIKLFLPGSLIDVKTVRDFTPYENKDLEFKVIKVDERRNNIVVSRKALLQDENSASSQAILEQMQEGSVVTGTVKNITSYGVFVDLGPCDGLIYITDLSWKRIKDTSEIGNIIGITIGQEITAKVLKFDREKHRISLGLKQLSDNPWTNIVEKLPVGTRLYAKVSNIVEYGAFVELESGIEGLVHTSEMSWLNKSVNPSKILAVDTEVQVEILDIDTMRRRISLGMKQCMPNPWEEFADKYEVEGLVTGVISSITDFGIFVMLDFNVEGVIHISEISWTILGDTVIRKYKKGQVIEAKIIAIEPEKEKISLSIKQLEDKPESREDDDSHEELKNDKECASDENHLII